MTTTAMERAQAHLEKRNGAVNQRATGLRTLLEAAKKQIALALPRHMTPERMIRIAYTAVQRSPKLLECSPESIVKSVIEASELGLEPSGILGHAYLVPHWNAKTRKLEAQLQVGYRGFIELAGRSKRVRNIMAAVVYDCDLFLYELGLQQKLTHVPQLNREASAKPIAVYAIAFFLDGGSQFVVLDLAEIARRMECSSQVQAKKAGKLKETTWDTDWEAMARKTAIRALATYLPMSPEITRAAVVDEDRDLGLSDAIDVPFVETEKSAELPERAETAQPEPPKERVPGEEIE